MNRFGAFLLAACAAFVIAASPALAQQDDQQTPMAGQGGMMDGQGKGMMDGQGKGMMGGQGKGMMGQGGSGQGKGMMQGGMMGQDKANCPKMGGMMGHGMMGKGGGMMHSRPMMEAHLAYIKTDLEITEAQTAAWDAYADAVRARHTTMESMHADMMKAKDGNPLERMDARIKATEAKLESLKALKPATEGLYAVLTDAQKEKADTLLGGGCGMM